MPKSGGSPVPTAEAREASTALGQEDAAIAHLPENAMEPESARDGAAGKDAPAPSDRLPPAGSHADPSLMNPEATPGSGLVTPAGGHDDVDSASG
jgi:hypothetical protein